MKTIPIQKNKEYIVTIEDNGFEGEGIAKIEDFTIFIPGAIKGEKIKILIVKVNSSYAFGKIIEIIEKSRFRTEPDCATYKRCGGCNLRHVEYAETLKMKQNAVQSLVNKTLTFDNLKGKAIYIPRDYEQTTKRIQELTKNSDLNLKLSNYRSIVRLVNEGMVIGVVTEEYLYDWEWKQFNLAKVNNTLGLGKVEFGVYLSSYKFKELNLLVDMIKEYFKN